MRPRFSLKSLFVAMTLCCLYMALAVPVLGRFGALLIGTPVIGLALAYFLAELIDPSGPAKR